MNHLPKLTRSSICLAEQTHYLEPEQIKHRLRRLARMLRRFAKYRRANPTLLTLMTKCYPQQHLLDKWRTKRHHLDARRSEILNPLIKKSGVERQNRSWP